MMQQPRGSGGFDASDLPDVEEPIIAVAAEEQQLTNPFAGMFGEPGPNRNSMYDNEEKMAKYNSSFAR